MTNNAKVGGVLSIVAGAFGLLGMLGFILVGIIVMVAGHFNGGNYNNFNGTDSEIAVTVVAIIYIVMGIGYGLLGALGIVGGIIALRKKHWGWALAGAIAGAITFFPCGVPAIIFTSLGKPEFGTNAPAAPSGPAQTIVG